MRRIFSALWWFYYKTCVWAKVNGTVFVVWQIANSNHCYRTPGASTVGAWGETRHRGGVAFLYKAVRHSLVGTMPSFTCVGLPLELCPSPWPVLLPPPCLCCLPGRPLSSCCLLRLLPSPSSCFAGWPPSVFVVRVFLGLLFAAPLPCLLLSCLVSWSGVWSGLPCLVVFCFVVGLVGNARCQLTKVTKDY